MHQFYPRLLLDVMKTALSGCDQRLKAFHCHARVTKAVLSPLMQGCLSPAHARQDKQYSQLAADVRKISL